MGLYGEDVLELRININYELKFRDHLYWMCNELFVRWKWEFIWNSKISKYSLHLIVLSLVFPKPDLQTRKYIHPFMSYFHRSLDQSSKLGSNQIKDSSDENPLFVEHLILVSLNRHFSD